jgi:ribonucleoside-triphosphate reductase
MSDRIKEIDDEITDLRCQLEGVEGTPTEVYTRIVGYYRSVRNWNPGKKAEYPDRKLFKIKELPEIARKAGNSVLTGEHEQFKSKGVNRNGLPFGIQFNEELTKTRIA